MKIVLDNGTVNGYFTFVEMVDTVLPSTLECDYTKIEPEELWLSVYAILQSSKIKFSEQDIQYIRNTICSRPPAPIGCQYDLYNRKSVMDKNLQGDGFDQNHWYIKEQVMRMRCAILSIAHKKLDKRYMQYSNKVGTYEEIDKHIERDKIHKHVSELMIMTKERKESNYGDLCQLIAGEICYYYGLPVSFERNDIKNHISDLIQKAFDSSKIFYDAADSKHKESMMDETLFKDLLSKATEDIVNYLHTLTHSWLKNSSELIHETNMEKIIEDTSDLKYDSEFEKSNNYIDEVQKDNDNVIEDDVTEYDMDVLIEKYNKMLLLAEKNKQLTSSLNAVEEKRKKLLAELDKLNYEADQLRNEINDNNVELGIGKKSGSK